MKDDKLRKFIKEIIFLEYNKVDSFLSNSELAKKHAYERIDDVSDAIDNYNKNPEDNIAIHQYEYYMGLIDMYVDKYNELKNKNFVEIYRLIKLKEENELDTKNIGTHWSFVIDGVGAYGGTHPKRLPLNNGKSFVLTGHVDPKFIDWKYGFDSFIWYGEDQWECALLKGARVAIIKINDKVLDKPIIGKVGNH